MHSTPLFVLYAEIRWIRTLLDLKRLGADGTFPSFFGRGVKGIGMPRCRDATLNLQDWLGNVGRLVSGNPGTTHYLVREIDVTPYFL